LLWPVLSNVVVRLEAVAALKATRGVSLATNCATNSSSSNRNNIVEGANERGVGARKGGCKRDTCASIKKK